MDPYWGKNFIDYTTISADCNSYTGINMLGYHYGATRMSSPAVAASTLLPTNPTVNEDTAKATGNWFSNWYNTIFNPILNPINKILPIPIFPIPTVQPIPYNPAPIPTIQPIPYNPAPIQPIPPVQPIPPYNPRF
jgi:hypothetical protein